jgi:hypothetical protein
VPSAGSSGVHKDLLLQALTPRDLLEDALSQRGTAYIAHTNEQDADHSQILNTFISASAAVSNARNPGPAVVVRA